MRKRSRDPSLPAQAGESHLAAPELNTVRRWIEERMLRKSAPPIETVTWDIARWKPGVSLSCTYAVLFADGSEETVVAKRYADGKDRLLSNRAPADKRWEELSPRMLPRVVLRDETTILFTQVADRELGGVPAFLDRRKLARLLQNSQLAVPGEVRRRKLDFRLVRYKPERRAVYRLGVELRNEARSRLRLGCRILPAPQAEAILGRRRRFEEARSAAGTPTLVGASTRHGLLMETWLDIESFAPDSFDHAELAGAVLADLHRTPCPSPERLDSRAVTVAELTPYFRVAPRLAALAFSVSLPVAGRTSWRHGDFHPDQIALDGESKPWILDLDLLAPGDPLRDLASWIADSLVERPHVSASESARPLLAGYARGAGENVDEERLWSLVADELLRRAMAAVRRLELGAVKIAERALARARELAPGNAI